MFGESATCHHSTCLDLQKNKWCVTQYKYYFDIEEMKLPYKDGIELQSSKNNG